MEPVIKVAIFLAAFGLLLVIGRMLSSSSEVHASTLPHPQLGGPGTVPDLTSEEQTGLSLVGSEIQFPIQLPPVERLRNGTFNRPIVTNYYFAKTDLVRGPSDPNGFVDEFTMEMMDPATGERMKYQYTVATPAGLRQYLEEQRFDSLYIDSSTVVVTRWDLGMILQTVIDQIMQETATEDRRRDQPADVRQPADRSQE